MKALLAAILFTHLWYPQQCCNAHRDCHPVPCTEIEVLSNGDVRWDGMTISKYGLYPSLDGDCHVCDHDEGRGHVLYCVFVQREIS